MTQEQTQVPFLSAPSKIFSTYDLGLSAGLVSVGYGLLQVNKNSGGKALFLFDTSKEIIESSQRYWRGELHVDALTYFNAIKTIKNQLY